MLTLCAIRRAAVVVACLALGCGDDSVGTGGASGSAGAGGSGGVIQMSDGGIVIMDDGGTWTCYVTSCAGHILQCGDCVDNDGDGLIDSHDPECLGPCDNTEGPGLYPDVGGGTGTSCGVDCYFDYGNGPGNDNCIWDHRCDPLSPEAPTCAYDPNFVSQHGATQCPSTQSPTCAQICGPYTPNGCDCFGCCTFPQLAGRGPGGGPGYVWIGALDSSNNSTCTFNDILDTSKCPACTPVQACLNTCERCEVCIGAPPPPSDCFGPDGGTTAQCPTGLQPCGLAGQAPCDSTHYCISGCCQPIVQ